jgi:hypothetical protein
VGSNQPLASIVTNAGGTLRMNGGNVTTTGQQTYNDNITLGADTVLDGSLVRNNGLVTGNGRSLAIVGDGTPRVVGTPGAAAGRDRIAGILESLGLRVERQRTRIERRAGTVDIENLVAGITAAAKAYYRGEDSGLTDEQFGAAHRGCGLDDVDIGPDDGRIGIGRAAACACAGTAVAATTGRQQQSPQQQNRGFEGGPPERPGQGCKMDHVSS